MGDCAPDYMDCNNVASDGCEANLQRDPVNCGKCGCQCGTADATRCSPDQQVEPITHGTPGCSAGQCTVGSCNPGWGDCNGALSDGCEKQITTAENCGVCGASCAPPQVCVCTLDEGLTGCACEAPDGATE
jgi:hypothetical protein